MRTYFAFLTAHLDSHRPCLERDLAPFCGLFAANDWFWSALRPLPRAWLPTPSGMIPADFAFWDGNTLLAVEVSKGEDRIGPLLDNDIAVLTPGAGALDDPIALGELLPESFHRFWQGERLPASPFRQPVPDPRESSIV